MAKQDSINQKKKSKLRDLDWSQRMFMYNRLCKQFHEADILYNLDITNMWGEYLLVAAKSIFKMDGIKFYYIMLLGLDKTEDGFKPNNLKISLAPEKLENLSYLKPIGTCKFRVVSEIESTDINTELEENYKNIDPWKYNSRLTTRKPVRRKYDSNGELVIKVIN